LESGCKSRHFIHNIQIYSTIFLKYFWNEIAKALMLNDVVEHIFMYGEIVRGNDERATHYYITRGRVTASRIGLR